MRLGINRNGYRIKPGLYALGNPDDKTSIFVSSNYKFSFDVLRKNIPLDNAWILVLDTKGINVWCAAGKGTFGTQELIHRIEVSGLKNFATHGQLILPQLAGPGVAAHEVRKKTGFPVIWGPVRAADIKPFLENHMKADALMRRVSFNWRDRIVLSPVEIGSAIKFLGIAFAALFLIAFAKNLKSPLYPIFISAMRDFLPLLTGAAAGTILVPLLLPILPGRAFSVKGAFAGFLATLVWGIAGIPGSRSINDYPWASMLPLLFLIPAFCSFAALNFTGASTYTSLSGVMKEMKFAMPPIIVFAVIGIVLLAVFRLSGLEGGFF
jgi:acetyl-CoA decarbonylase/synthase complex subunit gamma